MFWFRIALASVVTALVIVDFIVAKTTHGDITPELWVAFLAVVAWALGGGVKDAVNQRNGNGGDDR